MNESKSLTVAELVALLQTLPQDAEVLCAHSAGSGCTGVYGLDRMESLDQDPPTLMAILRGY